MLSPAIAATKQPAIKILMSKNPCDAKNPAVKSKLSPGKKKPIKRPDSKKTMVNTPKYPTV